jgi:hypothetical protein
MDKKLYVRYDEGRNEFVLTFSVPGTTELESSGSLLSDAFQNMAEQLEWEGL